MSNDFSYTLTRTLAAPTNDVWRAWTNPDEYARWAPAVPGSVELDVRRGGVWKAEVVTPEGTVPLTGSYHDVIPLRRLVMAMDLPGQAEPTLMTIEFAEHNGQTGIEVSQTLNSEQERDFSRQGTEMLLDNLVAHLRNGR